ncbi:hypothetical protein DPX16_3787 [Anabarilius grahami]|uniref:Secreted protein n=1 Tax=Anabarilius grahami TaxID=495550 RepID=A0A3N0XES2_ANAGA|nr:hypothetical protein DPX16_3787 [Anabarilius grahami]
MKLGFLSLLACCCQSGRLLWFTAPWAERESHAPKTYCRKYLTDSTPLGSSLLLISPVAKLASNCRCIPKPLVSRSNGRMVGFHRPHKRSMPSAGPHKHRTPRRKDKNMRYCAIRDLSFTVSCRALCT